MLFLLVILDPFKFDINTLQYSLFAKQKIKLFMMILLFGSINLFVLPKTIAVKIVLREKDKMVNLAKWIGT